MPSWAEALKLVGLTTPFIYAAATYAFFHWLDKRASGPAKVAISSWINSTYIDKQQSSAVAVEIFDRIYTTPLWGWRAITRSLLFTAVTTIVVVEQVYSGMSWLFPVLPFDIQIQIMQKILCNFVADYAALYLIRQWLIFGGARPLLSFLTGPLIGFMVVITLYMVTDVLRFSIETQSFHPIYFWQSTLYWVAWLRTIGISTNSAILAAGLIVYLWLPLFATGVVLAQGLNYFLKASGWMQWFIKRGKFHPLQAVGMVAALIVFVIASVFRFVF